VRVGAGPLLLWSKGQACWPGQSRSSCECTGAGHSLTSLKQACAHRWKSQHGPVRAVCALAFMGTLRLGAGQPRAAAAHLWAGAAACLLAALVLCGAACTDAAMGVSAVRPSALARALLARLATRRLIPCGLSYNLSSMPHNGRAPVQ